MNIKLIDEFVINTLKTIITEKAIEYGKEVVKDSEKLALIDIYNEYNIVLSILDNITPNANLENIISEYKYEPINEEQFIKYINDDLDNLELLQYYNTNIANSLIICPITDMIKKLVEDTTTNIINQKVPPLVNKSMLLFIEESKDDIVKSIAPILYTQLKPTLLNEIVTNSIIELSNKLSPILETKITKNVVPKLKDELSLILIPIIKENIKSTLKLEIKNEILEEINQNIINAEIPELIETTVFTLTTNLKNEILEEINKLINE